MDDKDIVITSAFRTPIGSYLGSLSDHTAVQLGTEVIKKFLSDILMLFFSSRVSEASEASVAQ